MLGSEIDFLMPWGKGYGEIQFHSPSELGWRKTRAYVLHPTLFPAVAIHPTVAVLAQPLHGRETRHVLVAELMVNLRKHALASINWPAELDRPDAKTISPRMFFAMISTQARRGG